jgi:signal transduction histidine kinase
VVQTADSLAPLAAAQFRLWWYTAAIGATGSVTTIAVGIFIAHQGYRPLGKILRRVQEIESSNLAAGLQQEPRPPELQRLADSLNSMWRRLDATFSSQQRFVAAVSHDLRTPLTALRGQIEVLMMNQTLSPQSAEALGRMTNEVNRLIRMTNNLLTAAQFDSRAPVAHSAVDLRELIRGVVMDMRAVARHVTLDVVTPMDVVVMGDYDLLKQALVNLVDNALKFTPAGGEVTLGLGVEAGEAVVSVADSGIGIPADRVKQLLESPEQARLLARSQRSGTGLGLSIVKRIVEVHQGKVDIVSREHSGTTVTFRIPLLLAVGERELVDQIA